ncbi:MAG: outer membrane lipoprotein carrier protein LolA [Desulfuromonadales bacterium]
MIRFFAVCALVVMVALPASAASLKEVVAALEKGYVNLQDVQADFSQSTFITAVNREQKGHGEVLLKRPASAAAMFRFNYAKPQQQIVSNGKQVWFYTAESKQVMVSTVAAMFKDGNSIALSYLTGLGNVSRDFTASFAREQQDKSGNYQIDLIPKNPSPVLARLQLTVSAQVVESFVAGGEVREMFPIISSVVHDAGGNRTRIDYKKVRVNKGLDSGKFNFKIPVGVEIVKP